MYRTRNLVAAAVLAPLVALTLAPARAQEEPAALRGILEGQTSGQAVAAAGDPAAVLAGFLAALDRGDVAGTMATFTDDAVLAGFGLCRDIPCTDLAGIRSEVRRLADEHTTIPSWGEIQVSAHSFVTRMALTSRSIEFSGLERVILAVVGDVRGNRLTSLRLVPDQQDQQTAAFFSHPELLPALTATQEGQRTIFEVRAVNRTAWPAQVEIQLFLWSGTVVESFAGLEGHNPPTVTGLADGGLRVGWITDNAPAARVTGPFVAAVESAGAPIRARVIMNFWGQSFSGSYVLPDLVTGGA